jgi:hypothetical protein
MTETTVSKANVEKALAVGDEASRLSVLLKEETALLKQKIEDYEKDNRLRFGLYTLEVEMKIRALTKEAGELAKMIDAFAEYRFLYLRDRLERKIRHSDSDRVAVTNTELFIVDNLSDNEIYQIYEKHKGRDHFAVQDNFEIKSLFSGAELEQAHKRWVKRQIWMWGFGVLAIVGFILQSTQS